MLSHNSLERFGRKQASNRQRQAADDLSLGACYEAALECSHFPDRLEDIQVSSAYGYYVVGVVSY